MPASHDYHLNRFLHEYFPKGTVFASKFDVAAPRDLPLAKVEAFSLDDAATTEIDDAFSLTLVCSVIWLSASTLTPRQAATSPPRSSNCSRSPEMHR